MGAGDESRREDVNGPRDDKDMADMWVLDEETGSYRMREGAAEELSHDGPGDPDRSSTPFDLVGAAANPAAGTPVHEDVAPARETAPPSVEPPKDAPPGPHRAARPPGRIRKRLKWVAISVVGVLLLCAGGLYGFYEYLNSQLQTTQKNAGSTAPKAAADEKGRRPMNILLIGSDARTGKGNEGYGDNGHEGLADTTILMHLSADRTNATLVSIPRDTMVPVPKCTVGDRSWPAEELLAFNETLMRGGAPCTVSTVDQMLGVQIDHYVLIDFNGVKEMTKAVGGVPICLTKPIDDPIRPNKGGGTDLFLTAGEHRLQGEDALKFLRARHAFGDGSDLARIEAQKGFLMSLAREVKSNATLTNVDGMLKIAQVATGNLQVDSGLGSIDKLIDLGNEIKKVPEKRMAFTTLPNRQWEGNPDQRVIQSADARQLWDAIASDTPLTEGEKPAATPTTPVAASTPTTPAIDPATVQVYVSNASGIQGKGTEISDALKAAEYRIATTRTNPTVAKSAVNHPVGQREAALAVATAVGLPATALHETSARANSLELVIGEDFPAELPTPGPTKAPTAPAPDKLKQKTAAETGCVAQDG